MLVQLSKGRQLTIPSEIRDALELDAGSKLEMTLKDKEIVLRPIGDDLKKLFDEAIRLNPKHKLTPKEMDAYNEALLR